ncbi:PqiC family protein [Caballeronia sp. LZ062]|uniref:PqiC family protein n=1 Tax=unclassified Caballeronia TaxID=2646786 RepID=UPI00286071EF|nr:MULTISPECIES: PqiC family protein [unclassified Caballeronia]MDR5853607.1 PqiC family protein [Caballeronia sp. LZ050]MDR5871859.1 PqiC family protein [Caballeronia sp. LZ062]
MRFGALLLTVGAAGALCACASSPSSRFYTLGGAGQTPATVSSSPVAFYFQLAPVDMPEQVSRNQLVVQTSPAQVSVLEQERWASLPGDEVRRALSSDLSQQLNAIDVYGTPYPESSPVYRVTVKVQRFESWPGSQAVLDAVWSVRAAGSQAVMTCRTVADERVGDGYDALVDGHRKAVDTLASAISAGVRSLASLPPAPAPANASSAKGKAAAAPNPRPAPVLPCPASGGATTASAQYSPARR